MGFTVSMTYSEHFSDAELEKIVEEGLVYMCACPAQVADTTRKVREMYRYQADCLKEPKNDARVHTAIANTAAAIHAQLEQCMADILEIEQWDRATLTMPPHLRKRQMQELVGETRPADLSGL